jgi:hypothetical protein
MTSVTATTIATTTAMPIAQRARLDSAASLLDWCSWNVARRPPPSRLDAHNTDHTHVVGAQTPLRSRQPTMAGSSEGGFQMDVATQNVQPHSGTQANQAVFFALLELGDTVLSMSPRDGGHLSHGDPDTSRTMVPRRLNGPSPAPHIGAIAERMPVPPHPSG